MVVGGRRGRRGGVYKHAVTNTVIYLYPPKGLGLLISTDWNQTGRQTVTVAGRRLEKKDMWDLTRGKPESEGVNYYVRQRRAGITSMLTLTSSVSHITVSLKK